jgi:phosphopantothenoylcysteine decarboxylase/phosphopantothenate--cysteine ligase
MVAPAMNRQMWENPATQRNVMQLEQDGVLILGPDRGVQACGETGMGRMLEPEQLLAMLDAATTPKLLAGKRVLITAGPTMEMIDPVRAITNISSGKMGYSIAQAAWAMGAEVTLVSGPTALSAPAGVDTVHVVSAGEMHDAVMGNISSQDIFISVAAVADYKPASPSTQKLKKSEHTLTLELSPNEDILAKVAAMDHGPFCVGFAAESEQLVEYASQKRLRKQLPLIVANLVDESMGKDDAKLTLIDERGAHALPQANKTVLAHLLLQHVAGMLEES